jgi:hypothetical protein
MSRIGCRSFAVIRLANNGLQRTALRAAAEAER